MYFDDDDDGLKIICKIGLPHGQKIKLQAYERTYMPTPVRGIALNYNDLNHLSFFARNYNINSNWKLEAMQL